MSKYTFEEFKSVGSRFNLVITLGKAERFYFGSSFCQKYNILSMVGAKMFYDKTNSAVAFKFLTEKEDGMVGIKKLDNSSVYINAKAFFGMYDINSSDYLGRYHPEEITDSSGEKMFVIELKETSKDSN